jgi:hypothetical protein
VLDRVPKVSPPASRPAAHSGRARGAAGGWGRAFGACCFAGKLRSPAGFGPAHCGQGGLPYVNVYVNPYGNLYAREVRTPCRLDGGIAAGRAPEGG